MVFILPPLNLDDLLIQQEDHAEDTSSSDSKVIPVNISEGKYFFTSNVILFTYIEFLIMCKTNSFLLSVKSMVIVENRCMNI